MHDVTYEEYQIVEYLRGDACASCIFNNYVGECTSTDDCFLRKAADMIESISAELDQVKQERDGLNILLGQAQSMLETRTRERDAAVEDLTLWNCFSCKHAGYAHSEVCASCMQASYESDRLTYEQYKDSDNEEKQSWAEQAKMRANKTAATYNSYILENSFVWKDAVPDDIRIELPILN